MEYCIESFGSLVGLLDVLFSFDRCLRVSHVKALDLCKHNFGHHVVQSVLEHGDARIRARGWWQILTPVDRFFFPRMLVSLDFC